MTRRIQSRLARALLASAAVLAAVPIVLSAIEEPEDELKAAIVLSFLRYGEWSQPPAGNAPLTVGVFGRGSFAEVLKRTVENKPVNQRSVRVLELKSPAEAQGCQVVYFASDRAMDIRPAVQAAFAGRALTIGESNDFLSQGGAVNLLVVDGHMSFEVSLPALERSGVNISSKLLRFGQIRSAKKGDRS